jgi:DnaJ-class molecular chaperone
MSSVLVWHACGTCQGLGLVPEPDPAAGTLLSACPDCGGSGMTQ